MGVVTAKAVMICALLSISSFAPNPAHAWACQLIPYYESGCPRLPGGTMSVKVDVTSFANIPLSPSLTSSRARTLVLHALSQWKERTGANLTFQYGGDVSYGGECPTPGNGVNEVGVTTDPFDPNLDPEFGETFINANVRYGGTGNSQIVEVDICALADLANLAGASTSTWTNRAEPSGGGGELNQDLYGSLVWMFGFGLGLRESDVYGVTMRSGWNVYRYSARYLFDDDINGIRALYPPGTNQLLTPYWQAYNPDANSWLGAPAIVPTPFRNSFRRPTIGVGRDNAGADVAILAVTTNDGHIHLRRANWPITATSSWSSWSTWGSTQRTSTATAIAADPDTPGRWLMAWTEKNSSQVEGWGIRAARSTNTLASAYVAQINGGADNPSLHAPALAYDRSTARWVLAFTQGGQYDVWENTGEVRISTSLDGATWTLPSAPENAGPWFAVDGPSLACTHGIIGQSGCIIAFIDGSVNLPRVVAKHITIHPGNGASTEVATTYVNFVLYQTPPSTSYLFVNNNFQRNLLGINWYGNDNATVNARFTLYSSFSDVMPPVVATWANTGFASDHPATIGSSPLLLETTAIFMGPQQ